MNQSKYLFWQNISKFQATFKSGESLKRSLQMLTFSKSSLSLSASTYALFPSFNGIIGCQYKLNKWTITHPILMVSKTSLQHGVSSHKQALSVQSLQSLHTFALMVPSLNPVSKLLQVTSMYFHLFYLCLCSYLKTLVTTSSSHSVKPPHPS